MACYNLPLDRKFYFTACFFMTDWVFHDTFIMKLFLYIFHKKIGNSKNYLFFSVMLKNKIVFCSVIERREHNFIGMSRKQSTCSCFFVLLFSFINGCKLKCLINSTIAMFKQ